MIDETGTDDFAALSSTSQEAERMINQRIEELRATALESMPDIRPHASAPAPHPAAAPPMPQFDAVLVPTQPAHRAPASTPDSHNGIAAISESVDRIEVRLHEDVARLERTLRSWGNPRETLDGHAGTLQSMLEQLSTGMSSQLSQVGAALAARVDARSNIQPLIEAMARWSVELQEQTQQQSQVLRKQLHAIYTESGTQSATRDARLAQAMEAAIRQTATTFDTRLSALVGDLQQSIAQAAEQQAQSMAQAGEQHAELAEQVRQNLEKSAEHQAQLRETMGRDVARSTARVLESITDVQKSVDAPAPVEAKVDALSESVQEFNETVTGSVRELNETLNEQLQQQSAETLSTVSTLREDLARQGQGLHQDLSAQSELIASTHETLATAASAAHELLEKRVTRQLEQQSRESHTAMAELLNAHARRSRSHTDDITQALAAIESQITGLLDERLVSVMEHQEQQSAQLGTALGLHADRYSSELEAQLDARFREFTTQASEQMEVSIAALAEGLAERFDARFAEFTTQTSQQVSSSIGAFAQDLTERIDSQSRTVSSTMTESLSTMAAAIAAQQQRQTHDGAAITAVARELTSVHDIVAGEFDELRLRDAEDTELMFDTVSRGWLTMNDIMHAMDERVARLEEILVGDDG